MPTILSTKKTDSGFIIKTVVCVLLLWGAMIAYSFLSRELIQNYLIILLPSTATTVPWLINCSIASLALTVMIGLTVVLVRPVWMALFAFAVTGLLYVGIMGPTDATIKAAGILIVFLVLYMLGIQQQLKNQINFSAHPLTDMKVFLSMVLAILVCVAFGMGYSVDAARRAYILPPEIKAPLTSLVIVQMKPFIDPQLAKVPAKQKQAALDQMNKNITSIIDNAEQQLKPYVQFVPIVMGALLFSFLSPVFFILAILSIILLRVALFLLRVTHVVGVRVEPIEAKRLTLKTIGLKIKS